MVLIQSFVLWGFFFLRTFIAAPHTKIRSFQGVSLSKHGNTSADFVRQFYGKEAENLFFVGLPLQL
ncbi:hypothetical protein RUMCAL_03414 [Ruminococcus callidus ATCC 27760]|uniref:Uncharacterized protein n=1 Tax=Ruminococcus callidus ATCC 27760 TaxID=411473 RepID=U2JLI8_9FIRM|nr:hypothetical protein RUMCAL_03414 [Ruminococcus callidus ATCC 27760]